MRDSFKYYKRKGPPIEPGGEAILVIESREARPVSGPLKNLLLNKYLLRAICRQLTTGNRGFRQASHRNTKTYRPLPTIWLEPLGRLCRINNHSCTEYDRIPRYGHSGSPSEGDSHIILARAGEASTGKAPYPYNCLPPTLHHPFQAAGEGGGHFGEIYQQSEFPIQIKEPIKKILRRLRDRGLISRRRPWPIYVAYLMNVGDGDIVNWSAGIAISTSSDGNPDRAGGLANIAIRRNSRIPLQATLEASNFSGVKKDIESKADMLAHRLDRAPDNRRISRASKEHKIRVAAVHKSHIVN
ncbi:hypothetical protein RND71_036889 [Anisodus tanguticus]|uniref:Uncharacterized protein n=1 Tax=Anisodus tanguticus TaxID=243964 RepID=A0AAE1V0R5_9SOLA|nr:hypothetical protein RND71_036889 [Anisodus tanguticus]